MENNYIVWSQNFLVGWDGLTLLAIILSPRLHCDEKSIETFLLPADFAFQCHVHVMLNEISLDKHWEAMGISNKSSRSCVWKIHAIWADSTFNSLITLPSLSRQLVLAISTGLANLMTLPRKNWVKSFYNLPHLAFVTLPFHHQISQVVCFRNSTEQLHVTRRLSAWQRRSFVISRGLGLAPSRSMACSPTRLESPQFDAEFGTAWEMNLQNYLQHKAKL